MGPRAVDGKGGIVELAVRGASQTRKSAKENDRGTNVELRARQRARASVDAAPPPRQSFTRGATTPVSVMDHADVPDLATLTPTLLAALAQCADAVVVTDATPGPLGPRIVYVNEAACRISGYRADELLGRTPRLFQGPRSSPAVLAEVRACLSAGRPFLGWTVNYRRDRTWQTVAWSLSPVRDASGVVTHFVSMQRLADESAAAPGHRGSGVGPAETAAVLGALQAENLWYQRAMESSDVGVYRWEAKSDRWYWSDKLYALRGCEVDATRSTPAEFYARVHPEDRARLLAAELACKRGEGPVDVDYRFVLPSGEVRWHREHGTMISDGVDPLAMLCGTVLDVTGEKLREEVLAYHAHVDALTGLPNRSAFDRRLGEGVQRAQTEGAALVLAFIDLNGFKSVNDRLGHATGDRVLSDVARCLDARLDVLGFVARLGGDEFAVLRAAPPEDVDDILRSVKRGIADAFDALPTCVGAAAVGAAVGVGIYPRDARSAKELLSRADAQMYAAKRTGERFMIFDATTRQTLPPR